jgi:hypothetical protein
VNGIFLPPAAAVLQKNRAASAFDPQRTTEAATILLNLPIRYLFQRNVAWILSEAALRCRIAGGLSNYTDSPAIKIY